MNGLTFAAPVEAAASDWHRRAGRWCVCAPCGDGQHLAIRGKFGARCAASASAMDTVDAETRSRNMGRIRSKDTAPETAVRSIAHGMGYRFRKNMSGLPGSPDIVFTRRRKVVFVHGCYWHRHEDCRYAYVPKSNIPFWTLKFETNLRRDRRVSTELKHQGWDCLVIWECESVDHERVAARLVAHLGTP